MRLLRVLRLARVTAGSVRHVFGAVQVARLLTRGADGLLGQGDRVGTHVRDVAVLVQALRDAHRVLRAQTQLAAGLLLQRRGDERRARLARVRLLADGTDLGVAGSRRLSDLLGRRTVEVAHARALEAPVVAEVAAGGDPLAVDARQLGGERLARLRLELALDVPVRRGAERHALPLTLDDHARRDRLHTPGRQARTHLAPQHRRHLVAVETVEDAARLLRVDHLHVELARVVDGALDGFLRHLVEDHALDRHLRLQRLEQVPRDGLALAVLIGGEVELVGVLQSALELGDLLLLVRVDDVVRRETVVDVDGELAVRALLHVGGHLARRRQVTDVPDAGIDDVVAAQIRRDLVALRGRFDDDEFLA